jgi:hypothetical protein
VNDGSQQASVTVEPELREEIFENGVQKRSFSAVESVLVTVRKLWRFVVDVIDFDEFIVNATFASVFQVFEDVVC